jgi:hypothetical protein
VRTIILHEPALASALAGVTAGRTSVELMSLLQLELENARRKTTASETNLGRARGFGVMDFGVIDCDFIDFSGVDFSGADFTFMAWLAFRRRGCT